MAAVGSVWSCVRRHRHRHRHRHLFLLPVLALLAIAACGHAVAAAAVVGKTRGTTTTGVVKMRELQWGAAAAASAARKEVNRDDGDGAARQADLLGERKKAEEVGRRPAAAAAAATTVVLELKHHSSSSSSLAAVSGSGGEERYLRRLLAADAERAASLQLPRRDADTAEATATATAQSGGGAAEVPLRSGIRYQTLNYVTTIALGGSDLTVIVDTGSDLTWVQCKPCRDCYEQRDPLFDPAGSATYAAVRCNASACASSLKEATGSPGSCATSGGGGGGGEERCYYALSYGDGSFSRGVLATDTVGVGGASVDGFVFGCGLSNRGLFGGTAGLMGLGRTELSLVSQTASRFGGVFSYCLPATTSGDSTGSLSLGGGDSSSSSSATYRNTTPIAYTRMIVDPAQPPFYFMNITGASVGATPLAAPGLGARNVLIDSGTVITRLSPSVYRAVRAEFTRQFTPYPAAPGFSILDTCYNLTGRDEVEVPLLTLRMEGGGGAGVTVDPAGMLFMVRKDGSQVCLAMASLPYEDQTPILGNYQQKNKRVVYDTVASRLGFADEDCRYV